MSDDEKKKNNVIRLEHKSPPKEWEISKQLDLFGQFVTNDKSKVSNTIEFWDSIPKFFLNSKQQEKLRTKEGLANSYIKKYEKDGQEYKIKIQPALIEEKDGTEKAFFPSVTEELVEEVLKKILTDQQKYGIHIENKEETWVKFSLSMIHKELKEHGKTRSREQIKQAIQVMNRSILILYKGKKEIWSGAILQDLVTVDRDKYIEGKENLHVARLPLFVSHAINQLDYRQFNYNKLMVSNNQLTRYIYKRLINRFTNANYHNQYHFMYSDIKQGSGLLEAGEAKANRRKVKNSLNELMEQKIISKYEVEEKIENRAVIDVKYIILPSPDFIQEQKAANKRNNNILDI